MYRHLLQSPSAACGSDLMSLSIMMTPKASISSSSSFRNSMTSSSCSQTCSQTLALGLDWRYNNNNNNNKRRQKKKIMVGSSTSPSPPPTGAAAASRTTRTTSDGKNGSGATREIEQLEKLQSEEDQIQVSFKETKQIAALGVASLNNNKKRSAAPAEEAKKEEIIRREDAVMWKKREWLMEEAREIVRVNDDKGPRGGTALSKLQVFQRMLHSFSAFQAVPGAVSACSILRSNSL